MEIVSGRNSKRAKGEYGSKTIDRISELPQGILQQILYFLSQEDAFRTSVLSKSWRNIWCTRSNLDFSDATFKGNKQKFLSVVDNTLQRYRDQKLCVEEFGLSILLDDSEHDSEQEFVYFFEKWIQILTIMGIKKFRFCDRSERISGFTHLPTVVFEAKSLQDLHVKKIVLDQRVIKKIVVLKHLKKLHLEEVCIEDKILEKIISSCPLVETLFLQSCKGLRNIEVNSLRHLKNLSIISNIDYSEKELCSIDIQSLPSLENIEIINGYLWFHKGAEFRNLNQLYLLSVQSSCHYLSSCKFPSLKHLSIYCCNRLKDIKLFIDAPNIVCFRYAGNFIPSISFATTTSREWNSKISLLSHDTPSSRLLKLKDLLKSLSQSKISVSIVQSTKVKFVENNVVQDRGCDKDVVENLIIRCDFSSDFLSLLNGALSICRPRNIGNYNLGLEMEGIGSMWKFLKQRENGNRLIQLRELEEVSIEIHNYNRKQWHPITMSELPNHKEETGYDLVRFPLKWRGNYVS